MDSEKNNYGFGDLMVTTYVIGLRCTECNDWHFNKGGKRTTVSDIDEAMKHLMALRLQATQKDFDNTIISWKDGTTTAADFMALKGPEWKARKTTTASET